LPAKAVTERCRAILFSGAALFAPAFVASSFIGLGPCGQESPHLLALADLCIAVFLVGFAARLIPQFWWLATYIFTVPLLIALITAGHQARVVLVAILGIASALCGRQIATHQRS